jgi:hypothetical protein
MKSKNDDSGPSESPRFSDWPLLHYFIAILIINFFANFFYAYQIYGCLSRGNDWDCKYDLTAIGVNSSNAPQTFLIWDSLFLSAFSGLVALSIFLVTCAPIYSLACYIGRRYVIRRNFAGIAFWIGAWILASLSLPTLAGARALSDPGHISWAVDLANGLRFAVWGLFFGMAYCAFAFLHRDRTVKG